MNKIDLITGAALRIKKLYKNKTPTETNIALTAIAELLLAQQLPKLSDDELMSALQPLLGHDVKVVIYEDGESSIYVTGQLMWLGPCTRFKVIDEHNAHWFDMRSIVRVEETR